MDKERHLMERKFLVRCMDKEKVMTESEIMNLKEMGFVYEVITQII